jgi:hypothetical protein
MKAIGRALRGIGAAVARRPRMFASVALGVFTLDILVPPLVLSVARQPVTSFTVNPLLSSLPGYLAAGRGALEERLAKFWGFALFWFSSDGQFGIEWGFAVTPADLARFVLMSLLVAAYFALWLERRDRVATRWGARTGGSGGVLGALGGIFGLSTGGCTVMGCGAPVLPVIGLAFVGLSSTTIQWMSNLSTIGTAAVLIGLGSAVLWLGWRVSDRGPRRTPAL